MQAWTSAASSSAQASSLPLSLLPSSVFVTEEQLWQPPPAASVLRDHVYIPLAGNILADRNPTVLGMGKQGVVYLSPLSADGFDNGVLPPQLNTADLYAVKLEDATHETDQLRAEATMTGWIVQIRTGAAASPVPNVAAQLYWMRALHSIQRTMMYVTIMHYVGGGSLAAYFDAEIAPQFLHMQSHLFKTLIAVPFAQTLAGVVQLEVAGIHSVVHGDLHMKNALLLPLADERALEFVLDANTVLVAPTNFSATSIVQIADFGFASGSVGANPVRQYIGRQAGSGLDQMMLGRDMLMRFTQHLELFSDMASRTFLWVLGVLPGADQRPEFSDIATRLSWTHSLRAADTYAQLLWKDVSLVHDVYYQAAMKVLQLTPAEKAEVMRTPPPHDASVELVAYSDQSALTTGWQNFFVLAELASAAASPERPRDLLLRHTFFAHLRRDVTQKTRRAHFLVAFLGEKDEETALPDSLFVYDRQIFDPVDLRDRPLARELEPVSGRIG